ncbi:hypothetical protein P8452_49210 [Trifolium repens]|nr:hypothetical protein P8452_49210 [Trifolium repens]
MVSQFWASRREMTQNNGRTRPSDERNNQSELTNQIANIHLATNNHFSTPQGIQPSFQGHPVILNNFTQGGRRDNDVILNNFTQGGRRDNNVVDAVTAPMVPFSLSGHNMTPVIPSARYGQMLSPSIPSDPRLYMDLHKINPYCAKSVKNSSSNGVDFQGYAQGFPNSFGSSVHNRTNFRYHPYGEGSNRTNNSSSFNDFNPLRSVTLTSMNGAKGEVIPTSNPSPYHPLQRKFLDRFCSSGNAGRDSTCDIASKSSNINPYHAKSVQKSSSSGVDFQGYALGFPNSFGPSVHNRKNFQYNPYGEGSGHMNDSLLFKNLNPLSVDLDRSNYAKDTVLPIATPHLDRLRQTTNLYKPRSSDNADKDAKSVQKSSSNGVGFQSYALGFPNYFGPSVHNRKNFQYNPSGEGSSRMNDSLLFNNFNPHLSVDLDRSNYAKDTVLPIATPHLDRLRQTTNLYKPRSSDIADKDLTCDGASKSCAFNIRDTEAWKRLKSFTSPDDCSEAVQTKGKELLIKDLKNTIPTSSVAETDDDNGNVDEKLDLELKL